MWTYLVQQGKIKRINVTFLRSAVCIYSSFSHLQHTLLVVVIGPRTSCNKEKKPSATKIPLNGQAYILISWRHNTVSERKLKTTLHIKSTERHQYLHYASSHPEHTKRSVVFSQTSRISRLCSEENDFKNYLSQMKSWFLKREYPEKLIEKEMRKVKFFKEGIKKAKGVKGIPFAVTYHPQLKNLRRLINQNSYLLNVNQETKKIFSPRPIVSSPRKISSYLVRAKLYPLE